MNSATSRQLSAADNAQSGWEGTVGEHQSGRADALARFIEPGRRAFELWLAVVAMAAAGRAWQRGTKRAWGAVLAAAWCFFLGIAVRQYLGLGIFP